VKPRGKLTRARVVEWLQSRHWLRVHMFVIVTVTFLAGITATKLLMLLGVDLLWLRYAISVCAAYLVFLFMIRLWIAIVCGTDDRFFDSPNGIDLYVRAAGGADDVAEIFGGGKFGGGGASGSWGSADDIAAAPAKAAKLSGGSDKSGCLSFDLGGDGEGCVVVILLAVLVGALLIAGGYLIYAAPAILGEAAFEALLAAALARRAKKLALGGWVGSVFRATVWIFVVVLALSITLGWYAQKHCPGARRVMDAIDCSAAARESSPR
jgi:hypothetical protein